MPHIHQYLRPTHTAVGRTAEQAAANFLLHQGFEVVECNWRTARCEIDIVCTKQQTVFFVEVKYRETANQGQGLDYITHKKLRQMMFAAESWVHHHHWAGDYTLAAIELSGFVFEVTGFATDLTL